MTVPGRKLVDVIRATSRRPIARLNVVNKTSVYNRRHRKSSLSLVFCHRVQYTPCVARMDVSTNSVLDFEVAVNMSMDDDERLASRMRGMGASARCDDVGAGYRDGPVPHSATEELSLAPPMFSGASRVDADAWLHRFVQYAEYKRLGDGQRLQLFKLLMTDAAADWLRALPDEATRDFRGVVQRFNDRFVANAASKNANVAALWNRRQRPGETAEDFITATLRIAARIPVRDEDLVRHAAVQGLKEDVRRFVLLSRCNNIEEVMEAARLAEATTDQTPATADRLLLQQLASQVNAIQEAIGKMSAATTASVTTGEAAVNVNAVGTTPSTGTSAPGLSADEQTGFSNRGRGRGRGRSRSWGPRPQWTGPYGAHPYGVQSTPYATLPATPLVPQPAVLPPTMTYVAPQQPTWIGVDAYGRPMAPPSFATSTTSAGFQPNQASGQQPWPQTTAVLPTQAPDVNAGGQLCVLCGRPHDQTGKCRALYATCYNCGGQNHFSRCCPLKKGPQTQY